mmetsp:Transcript_24385/g.58707  ORF Transcript_24385/g.58707 Transcript_24385/m.58707 type:complete len:223 (+) Transcript_24385:13-681(+)
MFQLLHVQEALCIMPSEFGKDPVSALLDILNQMFPNKVLSNQGLCVAVYDIVRIGEAQLHPGSPCQHMSVEFRLVMFRPFVGEILMGTVVSCDEDGMRISMGFFDEIHVPSRLLQDPSRWSADENLWVWDVTPTDPLFFDLENDVRFRVQQIMYRPPTNMASARQAAASAAAAQSSSKDIVEKENGATLAPAMQIIAGVDKPGLGLTSWWPPDQEDYNSGSD